MLCFLSLSVLVVGGVYAGCRMAVGSNTQGCSKSILHFNLLNQGPQTVVFLVLIIELIN